MLDDFIENSLSDMPSDYNNKINIQENDSTVLIENSPNKEQMSKVIQNNIDKVTYPNKSYQLPHDILADNKMVMRLKGRITQDDIENNNQIKIVRRRKTNSKPKSIANRQSE